MLIPISLSLSPSLPYLPPPPASLPLSSSQPHRLALLSHHPLCPHSQILLDCYLPFFQNKYEDHPNVNTDSRWRIRLHQGYLFRFFCFVLFFYLDEGCEEQILRRGYCLSSFSSFLIFTFLLDPFLSFFFL